MSGLSSNGSTLSYSTSEDGSYTKLFDIKGVPALIGKRKTLSTTTCSDDQETSIKGIRESTTPEFKGNYNSTEYETAKGLEGASKFWQVKLPDNSTIKWKGEVTMSISEAGYDDVLEMVATITTETPPTWTKGTGSGE